MILRYLLLAVAKCFQLLPEKVAVFLGLSLGWVLHRVIRFRHKIIYGQLKVVYGNNKNEEEIQNIIKANYRHMGLIIIEMLRLPGISKTVIREKAIFHGRENVEKALNKGKGVFILSGHIGSWEFVGAAWAERGYSISAIGKEMKDDAGNIVISLIRDGNGVPTIPRRNSMKTILRLLKKNEFVGVMLDQNMTKNDGVFVDFFGQKASTMPALAVLAARTGAAVLPAYTYRDPDLIRHHCVALPEIQIDGEHKDSTDSTVQNTQKFTSVLESIVDQHPDQWLWIHKRWKTRPEGESLSPFKY